MELPFAFLRPLTKAKLTVRLWEERDARAVIAMMDEVFAAFNWHTFTEPGGIDEHLLRAGPYYAERGGAFAVLERQVGNAPAQLIGCLGYYRNEGKPGVITFDYFFMHPKHQGQGCILPLLHWAANEIREKKIRHIEGWSNTARPRAHKLYRHLGFKQDGTVRWSKGANPPFQQYFFQLDVEDSIFSKPPFKKE